MALVITTRGDIDQIIVTSLPRAFVQRVYRHCWGKNNTPYFAGNCFRGVLYFDERLAAKYAEDQGLPWHGWLAAPKFYHRTGAVYEHELRLDVRLGDAAEPVTSVGVALIEARPKLAEYTARLAEDEVLCLLGAVDKGEMVFTLDDVDGPFDSEKLAIHVDRLSDLYCEESVITGMTYDGRKLSMETGESRGKNMIDPLLISRDGRLLDMYDFA
ncbi:hypothetical protein [Solidesulfovibrio sp. C21]|uniref:hypothetical protein n=1 Tax=Solidesulfovibrio sp. C21 TaxID=3398613 RepID=UPI0039FCA06D